MKIKVKYTAQLKRAVGRGDEVVDLKENSFIKDLLNLLFQKEKEAFEDMVFSAEGVFLESVLIILNGQQMAYDSSEMLKENDELVIMSPIAGG